jgi:hypothetical protein
VVVWEPPSRLVLAWQISGEWAYDADLWTEVEVTFTPDDLVARMCGTSRICEAGY